MLQSLNGIWKFNLAQNPSERPYWFFMDDFDTRGWKEIKVPANWELEVFDYPIYTNVKFPHKRTPPKIQEDYNPVGSYKRTFTIPENWKGNEGSSPHRRGQFDGKCLGKRAICGLQRRQQNTG